MKSKFNGPIRGNNWEHSDLGNWSLHEYQGLENSKERTGITRTMKCVRGIICENIQSFHRNIKKNVNYLVTTKMLQQL